MHYHQWGAIGLTMLTTLSLTISAVEQPLRVAGIAKQAVKQTAAKSSTRLTLTPKGMGKLSAKTEFSETVLKNALPGYQLKKATRGPQEDAYEIFEYYRQNKLAVEVYPDASKRRILSIIVLDDAIVAPKNARVGMSYRDITRNKKGIVCSPGVEAASKQVICVFKDARTMKYVFAPAGWNGSNDAMPPSDVLNQATLIKIATVFR